MPPSSLRRAPRVLPLALLAALAACDLPSSAPILQQTWVVPGDSLAIGVTQLLPVNVAVAAGGGAFEVNVPAAATFSTTLGVLCGVPVCQSGTAATVPIPAFSSSATALTRTVSMPAAVIGATVTGGSIALAINNQLGFDPLRPNGASAPYGTITISIVNGGTSTTSVVDGASQAMPSGGLTTLLVPLPAGVYGSSFSVSISMSVPSGASASLAASNSIAVVPTVSDVRVSSVNVVLVSAAITANSVSFDLEDVTFADQVETGGLLLSVTNPFNASAALNVRLEAPAQGSLPAVVLVKPVAIPAMATSSLTIGLTQSEIRQLVGRAGVTMTLSGTASGAGAGNSVTISPAQQLTLRTNVRLVLNVGG